MVVLKVILIGITIGLVVGACLAWLDALRPERERRRKIRQVEKEQARMRERWISERNYYRG